jgi:DNA sulfur modification protein DndB
MEPAFEYKFPAIRGIQANREYYVSMCPMRLLPKIFLFDEEELVPELRAQRTLNKGRLPELAQYILSNRDDYVFSAITASVDGDATFDPIDKTSGAERVGVLRIPMDARFIINDGQHRRAAIEQAIRENPDIADESIAVVFFMDKGLERCQQMFADLNRHAVRPSKSIGVLYDHRDENATVVKELISRSVIFRDVVELEKSTLSSRSRKLFTLSSIYTATNVLLPKTREIDLDADADFAVDFWENVAQQFPEWQLVREHKMTAGDVRKEFIHSHGITLQALAKIGHHLLQNNPKGWKRKLSKLKTVNWSRSNAELWEGRTLVGGRVTKSNQNVTLTVNAIKHHLELPLSPEEQRIEDAFKRGENHDN